MGDICKALCTLAPENIAPLAIPVLHATFNAVGQDNAQRLQQKEAELHQTNANNPHQPPDQVIKMAAAMRNVGLMGMLTLVRALVHFAFQGQPVEDPQALTAILGHAEEALQALERSLRAGGNASVEIARNRGELLSQLGRYEEARAAYEFGS